MARPLPTTAHALLGLLALRSWTTYELAQQARRSLRHLWPLSERQLYDQAKALVRAGLATATRGRTGARPRTVYAITDAGRAALRAWLEEPPTGDAFGLRSEALLKAFFAEQAGKAALLAQVAAVRDAAVAARDLQVELYERNLAEGFPFPERRHVAALVGALGFELAAAVERWAAWAEVEVAGWPDDLRTPPDHVDDLLAGVYHRPGRRRTRR